LFLQIVFMLTTTQVTDVWKCTGLYKLLKYQWTEFCSWSCSKDRNHKRKNCSTHANTYACKLLDAIRNQRNNANAKITFSHFTSVKASWMLFQHLLPCLPYGVS